MYNSPSPTRIAYHLGISPNMVPSPTPYIMPMYYPMSGNHAPSISGNIHIGRYDTRF